MQGFTSGGQLVTGEHWRSHHVYDPGGAQERIASQQEDAGGTVVAPCGTQDSVVTLCVNGVNTAAGNAEQVVSGTGSAGSSGTMINVDAVAHRSSGGTLTETITPSRPVPGLRALSWIVSLQGRTTRPATCKGCYQQFTEGEARLCTPGDRTRSRWVHEDCLGAGLKSGMVFNPDTGADALAARALNEKVAHQSALNVLTASQRDDADEPRGADPPTADSPLPAASFFASLEWSVLRTLPGDTFVQVPKRLEQGFADAVGIAMIEISRLGYDSAASVPAWKALLILPWLLLLRPPKSTDGESCASLLAERLDRFWQGDVKAMYLEHLGVIQARTFRRTRPDGEQATIRAKRVKTLVRAGEVSRALRAVHDQPRLAVTSTVAKAITSLYPTERGSSHSEAVPMQMDSQTVDDSIDMDSFRSSLLKTICRLPRLSAPSILGMRNEHLVVLAKSSEAQHLVALLSLLAVGRVPPGVTQFLRGGLIAPLEKDDGGFRPLTLANVLRRAALRSLVALRKRDVADAVGPLQYGVARKSGADLLYKSIQARTAAQPGSALVSIDFQAAFQNVLRSELCQSVAQHAPWCSEATAAWYGGDAIHVLYDDSGTATEVPASRGVDQGCPLGAFLFALAVRNPAEAILREAQRIDPDSHFYMYLDDGYLVIKPHLIEQIMGMLVDAFAVAGVTLNWTKFKIWAEDPSALSERLRGYYVADFRVLKRHLAQPGDLAHQGLPIFTAESGEQPVARQNLCTEIARLRSLTDRLQQLVSNGLDLQTALAMLRVYAGPASQHTLRSCWVSLESAKDYDTTLAACWSQLLARQISPEEPRLWLPTRMGGCGAASAVHRVNAATWASWSAVAAELTEHLGARDMDHVFEKAPFVKLLLSKMHSALVEQGTLGSIAHSEPARAVSSQVSQKVLVSYIQMGLLRDLKVGIDNDQAGMLRSFSGKASGAFLDPPLDDRWTLSNSRFATACRRRLCLPHPGYDVVPFAPLCSNRGAQGQLCGQVRDPDGKHPECCSLGGGLIERHDRVVRCLGVLAARNLDPRPKLEQVIPELARPVAGQIVQARLDVIVHEGTARSLLDVVIVSPYGGNDSFRAACARRDGHASRRAAVAKRARYPNRDLVPFALETGGRMGNDARAFLSRMADAAEDRHSELQYLQRAISSVLQDGIAMMLQPKPG